MMKRIIYISIVLVAGLLLSSCNKDNAGSGYLNLSVNGYTFGWSGSDTLRVEVMTNAGEWMAEPDSPAIKAEKDGDEAVITMQPNETSEYVSGTVTFTAGGLTRELYVDQMPKSFDGLFRDLPLSEGYTAMSRNGKWIAYSTQTLVTGDTYDVKFWLLNTETGELQELEEPPYLGMGELHHNGIRCISDDARYIVFNNDGETVYAMTIDREVYDVVCPEGYYNPEIESMSADGSVWVGFVRSETEHGYWPCRWIDGVPEILERPEIRIDGLTPTFNGTMARGCSDDGSIIYGSDWDDFLLVYWKDGELFNIGAEQGEMIPIDETHGVAAGLTTLSGNTGISADGKYIGCGYGQGLNGGKVPALVNAETGQYKKLTMDGTVQTIGPDGKVFIASPSMMSSMGYVTNTDFADQGILLEDWLQQEYGITVGGGRFVEAVSNDGKVLVGRKIVVGGLGASYPYWFIRLEK